MSLANAKRERKIQSITTAAQFSACCLGGFRETYFWRCWKISHSSFCNNLKATAKWWFSSTDSSLYIIASSEPVNWSIMRWKNSRWAKSFTWIDKKLIRQARMIDIVNAGGEERGANLNRREDVLQCGRVEENVGALCHICRVQWVMKWIVFDVMVF